VPAAAVLGNAAHRIELVVLGTAPQASDSDHDFGALFQQQARNATCPTCVRLCGMGGS